MNLHNFELFCVFGPFIRMYIKVNLIFGPIFPASSPLVSDQCKLRIDGASWTHIFNSKRRKLKWPSLDECIQNTFATMKHTRMTESLTKIESPYIFVPKFKIRLRTNIEFLKICINFAVLKPSFPYYFHILGLFAFLIRYIFTLRHINCVIYTNNMKIHLFHR